MFVQVVRVEMRTWSCGSRKARKQYATAKLSTAEHVARGLSAPPVVMSLRKTLGADSNVQLKASIVL